MRGPALVEVQDLSVRFGDTRALDGVSLTAPAGAVTAVVGGDGAGKTTLLRAVVGQVAPTSGSVRAPEQASIGYLPASSGSWVGLSVQENLEFVGGAHGLRGADLARRADDLLAAAGLEAFADRLSGQLSGGMRRKLGVILAMVHDPTLLVLDEPSTGVDPVSRVDLWRLASRAAAAGAAVLMSTTYLDEAERARHVLVLDHGRTLVSGTPAQVLAALPGVLTSARAAVRPEWAWRRGRATHELWPDGDPPDGLTVIDADLEDVVIGRALHAAAQRTTA
ncbi:MAG: ABC transporter ATP-binding protein [Candidatus Nanopelagicales bacterium]